ncbi:MAG: sialate O-acetylesterase, partial [Pseudomonadota bacterium]
MSDRYTFDNPISRLTQARAEQLNAEFGAIAVSFTHVYTKDEIDAKEFVTANIADAAITLGKLANLPAMQVVGNLTNASSTPVAVPVLDENALASNSPSALPTQRSVKAYADALDTAVRAFIAASDDSAAISAQAAADALSDTIDARDEAAQIVANIADADPYLASNVTFDPTSTSLTSTDVQGVVVELATDLASVDAKASIQASWTETDPASLAYIHDKPVLVAQADLDQAVADAVAGYTTPDIAFRDSGDGLTLEYETTTDPGVWRDFLDYAKITDVAVREVRAPETAVRILRERGVETAPGVTIEVEDRTEAALLTPGVAHGVRDGAGRLASATLSDGGTFVADLKADRASIDGADLAVRDGRYLSAITDPSGRVLAGWLRDGTFAAPGGQIIDYGESDYAFAYRDPAGNVAFGLRRDGTLFTPGGDSMSLLTAEMDRTAVGHATGRRTPGVTQVQRPTADYNTLVVYGQSLGVGNETWPAISRDNQAGNLTLGAAPLPANGSSDGYTPVGSSALQPLGAVTLSDSATRSALSDAAEAALPPGDQAVGEPPNHGFANGAKVRHNARLLVENDASRAFVTVNPGVGGRTIEQLSKGADHYTRYEGALSGLTTAVGASMHVIAGILWMQGEYNYATTWGGDATKAGYKAFLDTLIDDMQSDAMAATGQARPPVFLSYQTGGAYTQDADANGDPGLHVGMAQLEIATERPDA